MGKEVKHCNCCGAKIVVYPHTLSERLVDCMLKLYKKDNYASHLDDLGIDRKQNANFQKLRYFGLVEKKGTAGYWGLTYLGVEFIAGKVKVASQVWSYRGDTVAPPEGKAKDIKYVNISDYFPKVYQKREDYNKNAISKNSFSFSSLPLFK